MERAMSVEDKIRRAEEIYYRRRGREDGTVEQSKIHYKQKKDIKLLKKLLKQIIICLMIYGTFYLVINNNYIFSEDFRNKVKEILAQDINIKEISANILDKVRQLTDQEEQSIQNTEQEDLQNNDENIGGAEENLIVNQEESIVEESQETTQEEQEQQLSQMEQDANYIKSTISFIKPVEGKVSSAFGERNPTTPTVPKNHNGTDIAAIKGTKIFSATDGTVILSSEEGDYGKHLQIQINDVIVVYAHCNKLYVKEGDCIKQGQEIAEVGETGNATGPHLHFEIRYQNRYIDPQMILEL